MQNDVEQPAQAHGVNRRQPGDRLRIEHAVADDAQPSGSLRDQDVAVRQEREAPRILEAFRYDRDFDLVALGVERPRAVAERHGLEERAAASGLCAGLRRRRHDSRGPPRAAAQRLSKRRPD